MTKRAHTYPRIKVDDCPASPSLTRQLGDSEGWVGKTALADLTAGGFSSEDFPGYDEIMTDV